MATWQPEISVIVPVFNAQDTIDCCLRALAHQTVPSESYEIIVVDDESLDDTCTRVRANGGVHLITKSHGGPAAARNLGVQYARGEIVLFTDSDCEPTQEWVERMVAPFRSGEIVGVKGTYLTRQREVVARFVQMEYEDKYDRMAREKCIDFVDTYAAGYRRDVFMANGGFDITFPEASVEDQEFSFRLARQGYRLVFVPEAQVYHWGHPHSLWAYWRRKLRIGYWKVVVARRHPNKLLRDSHTPHVLKLQILLVGLAGLFLLGSFFWPVLQWGIGIMVLLFLLSTIPFVLKAWRKDTLVALISPGLLFARALALGTGFVLGLVSNLGLGRRGSERKDVGGAFCA